MSLSATCPGCNATYQLADTMRGKKVRCKSCSDVFLVRGTTMVQDRDENEAGIQATPRPPKRVARYEEDEDTGRPSPRRRPREKRGSSALVPLIIAGSIVAFVLIVGLAVVAVWAISRSRQPQTTPVASSVNPAANVPQPAQGAAPPQNPAGVPPQPERPAPAANPNPAPNPGNANPPPMVPPVNPPVQPQMPAQGPLAAQLSNGNVSGFGAHMEVKVDYRFTSGNPAGRRIFLLIRATKAAGLRQTYYIAELKSIGGQTVGTINAGGITFGSEHGPFEMCMAEGPPGLGMPRTDGELKKISNVVTVAFRQTTVPGMRPPIGPRRMRP
jgi:hypothetical protein